MGEHKRPGLTWARDWSRGFTEQRYRIASMLCDCCDKHLGWGAMSFEGADLICDECADQCYPDVGREKD